MATRTLLVFLAAFNQELPPQNVTSRKFVHSSQKTKRNCHSDTPETSACSSDKHPMKRHVILEHDNAYLHTTYLTSGKIEKYCWKALPHFPYTLDLTPSYCLLFGPLKVNLRASTREMQSLCTWLQNTEIDFRCSSILKPLQHCAEMAGSFWGSCGILIGPLH
jgi:hypothetical protein